MTARFVGQGAHDGSPLAHTARQLGRVIFLESSQAGELDELLYLMLALFSRIAFGIQTEADVFLHGQPGKELAFLWNVTHFGVEPAHFFVLGRESAREDGGEKPAMSLSRVDFPQPLGPTTVTNSPWGTFKEIFWSALIAPALGVRKSLETFSTRMTELFPGRAA